MYDASKTADLMRFAEIQPGSTVVDVFPGKGDWTRLFSDAVGPKGRVYSFVPAEVAHFESDPVGQMAALARQAGDGNVQVATADVFDLPGDAQSLDVIWVHLFYHDLHTPLIQSRGATAALFNQSAFDRLKPGGRYIVIDHAASAGAGAETIPALHRIDPALVRREVEAAGFVLDAETTLLANSADPHSVRVFDPAIKGATDRFGYRFVRP
ncbi:MAG: methyltransferase [Brevundimonas sp.]|nr:MAG: methyltransferase [Brevundimonas sp.]